MTEETSLPFSRNVNSRTNAWCNNSLLKIITIRLRIQKMFYMWVDFFAVSLLFYLRNILSLSFVLAVFCVCVFAENSIGTATVRQIENQYVRIKCWDSWNEISITDLSFVCVLSHDDKKRVKYELTKITKHPDPNEKNRTEKWTMNVESENWIQARKMCLCVGFILRGKETNSRIRERPDANCCPNNRHSYHIWYLWISIICRWRCEQIWLESIRITNI